MNTPTGTSMSLSKDQLAEIVRRLVAALSPRSIYLFGSHAGGLPRTDSDIDIMVIIEEKPTTIEHHQQGYASLRGIGLPVELHITPRSRFERFSEVIGSLPHEILRKGILIYAAQA